MALSLNLKGMLGTRPSRGRSADEPELEMPTTTQVKMTPPAPGYDPLASVSIMEQLRTAAAEKRQPGRLPFIGHLPAAKQYQILGTLIGIFVVLGLLMLFLYITLTAKTTAAAGTATEMQMLSQRLARGTSLAVQGNAPAFDAVKDSRDRFRSDLDALTKGGTVKGASVDAPGSDTLQSQLSGISSRWDRVEKYATQVLDNQASLVSLSKGLEGVNQVNTTLLELAQQASAQAASGGGSVREIDFTSQLAML